MIYLQKYLEKHWSIITFILIFFVSLIFRFKAIESYNVAFTSDQARDMLEIRQIVVGHSPKLLGPITDILGLYLGPFWYYLNIFPFILGGGNPLSLVYFSIFLLQLASIFVYFISTKKDKILGLLSASTLLMSSTGFLMTRFSFNANAIFYFSPLFPLFILSKSKMVSMIEGLFCGLVLQLQAAIGILFFPISFVLHYKRSKNERHLIPLIFGFLITLIPQIVFEITHGFLMTKALATEFFKETDFLGSRLTIIQIIFDRFTHFLALFSGASSLPLMVVILVIVAAPFLYRKKSVAFQLLKLDLQILLVFLFFFFIYPYKIKEWYLYGLVPFAIIVFASSLTILWNNGKTKIIAIGLFCLMIITSISTNLSYLKYISQNPSNDPSNLNNMLHTVDAVYTVADNQSLIVYSYLPSVYDYPYQYLFWWYGTKKYGYQPREISYLPDVPEYITNNPLYWTKKKETDPSITVLIIQHDLKSPERESDWRSRFGSSSGEVFSLPWNTTIEKLK